MRKFWGKRGVIWETLIFWLIGVLLLILMFVVYMVVTGRAESLIEWFKNLVRFGG